MPVAVADIANNPTRSAVDLDESDDWLGLGDVLGTQQQQQRSQKPVDSMPTHSASSLNVDTPPVAHAAAAAAAASDNDDDDCYASFAIQNEVEDWVRGISSCDSLGIMVRRFFVTLVMIMVTTIIVLPPHLPFVAAAAAASAYAHFRACSLYGSFTHGAK
jgi:hypothetical protein